MRLGECSHLGQQTARQASSSPPEAVSVASWSCLCGLVEVGAVRRQLSSHGARTAAEACVVSVRAVLCAHDQLAVGEERVVRAVGVDVSACHADGHLGPVRCVLIGSLAPVRA